MATDFETSHLANKPVCVTRDQHLEQSPQVTKVKVLLNFMANIEIYNLSVYKVEHVKSQ